MNLNDTINTTSSMSYPCIGSFRSDSDIISQMISNSTTYASTSPPLMRLMLIMRLENREHEFTRALILYSLVVFVSFLCSATFRVLIVRSGLQSSVAFVLERGNRCNINLAARRRATFGCLVGLLELCLQLPHIVLFVAGIHLGVLAGRFWVGLLTMTFGMGVVLVLFATCTSLSACGHCGPQQHRSVARQLVLGLVFILITWVIQVMTLMREFYSATAMALTLSSLPLMVMLYLGGSDYSSHFAKMIGTRLMSNIGAGGHHSRPSNLKGNFVRQAHDAFQSNHLTSNSRTAADERVVVAALTETVIAADEEEEEDEAIVAIATRKGLQKDTKGDNLSETTLEVDQAATAAAMKQDEAEADTAGESNAKLESNDVPLAHRFSPFAAFNTLLSSGNETSTIDTDRTTTTEDKDDMVQTNTTTSSLKSLQGRVRSVTQSGVQTLMTTVDLYRRRLRIGLTSLLFLSSILILIIYASLQQEYAEEGWKYFGWYSVLMTVILDVPALAAYSVGMIETPGISSLLLVVNRFLVLSSNGGNFMLAEFIGFVGYGLWFCLSNVDLRMGVSRKFASTRAGETLPVLGDLIAKTHVLGLVTPHEFILFALLCAYLASYFGWASIMAVDVPSCPPQASTSDNRLFLLVAGVAVMPIVGVARASCWLMRVSGFRRVADAALHHCGSGRTADQTLSHGSIGSYGRDTVADFSDFGKFCYGVFLAVFTEMLICVVVVSLQYQFPSVLPIDLELSILFVWPLVVVARAGLQRWVWLDFPVYDGRVWCYFVTFDILLAMYTGLTAALGDPALWGPIGSLLVLVVMGSFIPLVEIGGRGIIDLRQLSWFGLSWGFVSAASHVASHALVFFIVSPPLTVGYIGDISKKHGPPPFQLTRMSWIVILTGTFIIFPLLVHVGVLIVKVMDSDVTLQSTRWSLWIATSMQVLVWCWFVLLCVYDVYAGLWTIAIYSVVVCGVVFLVSILVPEMGIDQSVSRMCCGKGKRIVTMVMAVIPLIPLVVQLIMSSSTGNVSSSNSRRLAHPNSTVSSDVVSTDSTYSTFVTAAVAINLVHWIWGNAAVSTISLLQQGSNVWCTPTIFPVYGWDASLGEHGQLTEKNSGLAHCFAALGEVVLLCLLGTFFAYPVHFYALVATSNLAIVLSVSLVMELITRPIWNYVGATERLRNAMLLTATQGNGGNLNGDDEDGSVAAERMFVSTLKWAWSAAAQSELKYQDGEMCSLVAVTHLRLLGLLRETSQDVEHGHGGMSESGIGSVPFVTSTGIVWSARRTLGIDLLSQSGSNSTILPTADKSQKVVTTCCISAALRCFLEPVDDEEGGFAPPKDSAYLVKAEREKLIHLHTTESKKKKTRRKKKKRSYLLGKQGSTSSSSFGSTDDEDNGNPDKAGDKNEMLAIAATSRSKALGNRLGFELELAADEDGLQLTMLPVLALVTLEMVKDEEKNNSKKKGDGKSTSGKLIVEGSSLEALSLVKKQLGGSPDVWCKAAEGVLTAKAHAQLIDASHREVLNDVRDNCGSNHELYTLRVLRRALGTPSVDRDTGRRQWCLFLGDLTCDGDGWLEISSSFYLNILKHDSGEENLNDVDDPTRNIDNEEEYKTAVDTNLLPQQKELQQKELQQEDEREQPVVPSIDNGGKQADTTAVFVELPPIISPSISIQPVSSDSVFGTPSQSDTRSDNISDVPDLERFLVQTDNMETRHEMHTRLLVGQAAVHFVKRASTMFRSFLDWCSSPNGQVYTENINATTINSTTPTSKRTTPTSKKTTPATTADILQSHTCSWLSQKYIKLNWSGDGLHVPDVTGATYAHVREISFGEVMRWSLLPPTTELRQMYERQRVVFGIFCANRIIQNLKTKAAADREVALATMRELRRAKTSEYERSMRALLGFSTLLEEGTMSPSRTPQSSIDMSEGDNRGNREDRNSTNDYSGRDSLESAESERSSNERHRHNEHHDDGRYIDSEFEGARALYENPVNPASTEEGRELSLDIEGVVNGNRSSSISANNQNSHNNYASDSVIWARPSEFMDTPCLTDGFAADDIEQGILGDCWLLSAMSAVAHSHGYILEKYTLGGVEGFRASEMIEDQQNKNKKTTKQRRRSHTPMTKDGKYDIRIHVDGAWKTITVDDRIPCLRQPRQPRQGLETSSTSQMSERWSRIKTLARFRRIFHKRSATAGETKDDGKEGESADIELENGSECIDTTLVPAFARSSTRSELWVSLLEKAIAKHYGSYEAITGGLIHVAMSLLTGGIGQMIKLEQAKKLGHVTNGRLWLRMFNLHKEGHLLAAGSPPVSPGEPNVSDMGIVHGMFVFVCIVVFFIHLYFAHHAHPLLYQYYIFNAIMLQVMRMQFYVLFKYVTCMDHINLFNSEILGGNHVVILSGEVIGVIRIKLIGLKECVVKWVSPLNRTEFFGYHLMIFVSIFIRCTYVVCMCVILNYQRIVLKKDGEDI